jgi:peptidoglycan/LPS O-acetylase OafA/YrhL
VRGFAAMTIFIYHYGGGAQSNFLPVRAMGTVLRYGGAGVALFFALSGFLISGILWDGFSKPNWWKRFYIRRSLRIFPLYYLALAIAVAIFLGVGIAPRAFSPLLYYVFYLGDLPVFSKEFSNLMTVAPLGHFWSLAVEEQFYIFWPFLLVLFVGKRRSALQMIAGLWVVSLLFRIAMASMHLSIIWQLEFLLGRGGELLVGAYLALVVRGSVEERKRLFRFLPALGIVSLLLLAVLAAVTGGVGFDPPLMSTVGLALCSIVSASVVGCSLEPGITQAIFSNAALRWLGKISYGIYVYHMLLHNCFTWIVDRIAPHMGANPRLILLFFVALAGTLAVASLSFYTFESAFLRLKDRFVD